MNQPILPEQSDNSLNKIKEAMEIAKNIYSEVYGLDLDDLNIPLRVQLTNQLLEITKIILKN